ncbi:hypothetical protein [Scytonema sp. PCC 10023]|uniref:hypothetical protein n=1 Tax=Scytonema sp. PCC 10023 TaxID=1680591 RepID=UPI0039C6A4E8
MNTRARSPLTKQIYHLRFEHKERSPTTKQISSLSLFQSRDKSLALACVYRRNLTEIFHQGDAPAFSPPRAIAQIPILILGSDRSDFAS